MSLERFEAHIADPAPGFQCYDCSDDSETLALLAVVTNRVGPPGTADAMAVVTDLGFSRESPLGKFVALHDGVLLYCDSKSDDAGVEFFAARDWKSRTEEMRESMSDMGFEMDTLPEWFHRGIVIGEIPCSANYLVVDPDGEGDGQVYYCDHDDFQIEPLAPSFEALLNMIVDDPPGFMFERGC